jgi:hypothetical protein
MNQQTAAEIAVLALAVVAAFAALALFVVGTVRLCCTRVAAGGGRLLKRKMSDYPASAPNTDSAEVQASVEV